MGNMSAIAKANNKMPKPNSKSHKEKETRRIEFMSKRLLCEKCGNSKSTLYKTQDENGNEHYYCSNCR